MTLEGTLMYCNLVFNSNLKLEPVDGKIIRKLVRTQKKAKEIEKEIQDEMEKKEETRKRLKKEKEQRKEEKERKRKESLLGIALEIDIEKVRRQTGKDLLNQLLLWRAKNPTTKIALKGSVAEKRERIIQLIKAKNLKELVPTPGQAQQVEKIDLMTSNSNLACEIEVEIQPKETQSQSNVVSHLSGVSHGEKEAYEKRKRKRNPRYDDWAREKEENKQGCF